MKDKSSSIVYIIINLKIVKNIKIRNIQELLLNNYINILISILLRMIIIIDFFWNQVQNIKV